MPWVAVNRTTTKIQHHRQDQKAVESKPGVVSQLKNSCSMASRGAERLRALPKSCHLLPPTAIFGRKTATLVSTVTFRFLSLEGVPASLVPGL